MPTKEEQGNGVLASKRHIFIQLKGQYAVYEAVQLLKVYVFHLDPRKSQILLLSNNKHTL